MMTPDEICAWAGVAQGTAWAGLVAALRDKTAAWAGEGRTLAEALADAQARSTAAGVEVAGLEARSVPPNSPVLRMAQAEQQKWARRLDVVQMLAAAERFAEARSKLGSCVREGKRNMAKVALTELQEIEKALPENFQRGSKEAEALFLDAFGDATAADPTRQQPLPEGPATASPAASAPTALPSPAESPSPGPDSTEDKQDGQGASLGMGIRHPSEAGTDTSGSLEAAQRPASSTSGCSPAPAGMRRQRIPPKLAVAAVVTLAVVFVGGYRWWLNPRPPQAGNDRAQPPGDSRTQPLEGSSKLVTRPKTPQAGAPWTNSLGMRFVAVPQTQVLFCIWETRVRDYAVFAGTRSGTAGEWKDAVWQGKPVTPGPDCPAVNVSWEDAKAFCDWLTRKERADGRLGATDEYRLPTDWEWSMAVGLNESRSGEPKDKEAKAPDLHPWGKEWPPPRGAGNYADATARQASPSLSVIAGYEDGYATTSPVGSFQANQLGIHDLSGNVWEWCEDFYDRRSGRHVIRGGCWAVGDSRSLLSSRRVYGAAAPRYGHIGFRCVLAVGVTAGR